LLLELEANVVVALNMFDVAKEKGYQINVKKLSEQLGVSIVPTVATTRDGMEELKDEIVYAARRTGRVKPKITYGEKIEDLIHSIVKIIKKDETLANKYPPRWLAIKLLEKDEDVLEKIKGSSYQRELLEVMS
jgi:ferrous iron transport protein B